jgi:hypothetical protein
MRLPARSVPRNEPATFELPPPRHRYRSGTSRIRRPAHAAFICISIFQPLVISCIPRPWSASRLIARKAHMSVYFTPWSAPMPNPAARRAKTGATAARQARAHRACGMPGEIIRAVEHRPCDLADKITRVGAVAVHEGDGSARGVRGRCAARAGSAIATPHIDHPSAGRLGDRLRAVGAAAIGNDNVEAISRRNLLDHAADRLRLVESGMTRVRGSIASHNSGTAPVAHRTGGWSESPDKRDYSIFPGDPAVSRRRACSCCNRGQRTARCSRGERVRGR